MSGMLIPPFDSGSRRVLMPGTAAATPSIAAMSSTRAIAMGLSPDSPPDLSVTTILPA